MLAHAGREISILDGDFSLSKKSSENWAFSFRCGKIKKKGRKSEGNAGNRTDEQR